MGPVSQLTCERVFSLFGLCGRTSYLEVGRMSDLHSCTCFRSLKIRIVWVREAARRGLLPRSAFCRPELRRYIGCVAAMAALSIILEERKRQSGLKGNRFPQRFAWWQTLRLPWLTWPKFSGSTWTTTKARISGHSYARHAYSWQTPPQPQWLAKTAAPGDIGQAWHDSENPLGHVEDPEGERGVETEVLATLGEGRAGHARNRARQARAVSWVLA